MLHAMHIIRGGEGYKAYPIKCSTVTDMDSYLSLTRATNHDNRLLMGIRFSAAATSCCRTESRRDNKPVLGSTTKAGVSCMFHLLLT